MSRSKSYEKFRKDILDSLGVKVDPPIGDWRAALRKDLGQSLPSYQDPDLGDYEAALDNMRGDEDE